MGDLQRPRITVDDGPLYIVSNPIETRVRLHAAGHDALIEVLHYAQPQNEGKPFTTLSIESEHCEVVIFASEAQLDEIAEAIRVHREQTR